MSNLKSKNFKMITLTLWMILGYDISFVWTEFFGHIMPESATWLIDGLDTVRVPLTIIEFFAISTLFVDLVLRFDRMNLKLRTPHVIAVGICATGFIFKFFVFFLHSSYLS